MSFNAGKYQATSTNEAKTEWAVVSHDGKEKFTVKNTPVGTLANQLMVKTAQSIK